MSGPTQDDLAREAALMLRGLAVVHHACDACGITSEEVPLFSVGDVWLCGPIRCGVTP